MAFFDKLSKVANVTEETLYRYAERQIKETEKILRKQLREKSDAQIERAYKKRYDNPNLKNYQIDLIEEEAHRRGLD